MKRNPKLLALLRAKIAADNHLKKNLARECGISRPYFSQMLHGDVVMREDVLDTLLDRLCMREAIEELGLI